MHDSKTNNRLAPTIALVLGALANLGFLTIFCALVTSGCGKPIATESSEVETEKPTNEKLFSLEMPDSSDSTKTKVPDPAEHRIHPQSLASQFKDVAAQSGLSFTYVTGAQGRSLMVETMGGGCGALDFDSDGNWEVFLCQGGEPSAPPSDKTQPTGQLFRNTGGMAFSNVSAAMPVLEFRYGQGVCIGDYDADGFDDIYITNVGENWLLRNMGDGTYLDVTDKSGTADPRWSSSAAFADLNRDGLLDLYVCNYLLYDPRNPIDCRNSKGEYRICHPREIEAVPDACFINLGDGAFRDEATELGLVGEGSKGLGVAVADFSDDGLPDIYVANDTTANFYFVNQGGDRYQDQAMLLGCAMDRTGAYQASMGLGIGDFNRDGLLDIYSAHFYDDSNTLYENLGQAGFQDVTAKVGLHQPTLEKLGFGAIIEDFNFDGYQEILVTNGHIENYPENTLHEMTPQLFAYDGRGFVETSSFAGEFFLDKYVGRGVCQGDFDNDGDLDVVVVHQDEPAALLRNEAINQDKASNDNRYINFAFRGHPSNRRGIGVKVNVTCRGVRLSQQLIGGGSYASTRQPLLCFGLGTLAEPVDIEVFWPNGEKQSFESLIVNKTYVVDQKRGIINLPEKSKL